MHHYKIHSYTHTDKVYIPFKPIQQPLNSLQFRGQFLLFFFGFKTEIINHKKVVINTKLVIETQESLQAFFMFASYRSQHPFSTPTQVSK